jgi:uncharacterized protein
MRKLTQKYGKTALIAGASEGIGAAYTDCLAAEGMDLVLVARRLQPLLQLATQLEEKYKINVTSITCDLASANAAYQIQDALNGKEINFLVYNAALSHIGPFLENTLEDNEKIARVNMITPMNMIHVFGEKMVQRERGAIILMASLAGFQGSGFLSMYAATKAFNRILGESLWYEWKEKGVDVIACCAGATATPNYIKSNPEKSSLFAPRVLTPEEVASECLKKLGKGPSFITGRGNRVASFFMQRLMPRKLAITIMSDTTRKIYRL